MKSRNICLKESTGRTISSTIHRADGKKLLAKGHVISEEDARTLATEGLNEVWVTELEEGEVGEGDAVMQVATKISCGPLEVRLAAGGRANLFATEPCCILVDDKMLMQINSGRGMAVSYTHLDVYKRQILGQCYDHGAEKRAWGSAGVCQSGARF